MFRVKHFGTIVGATIRLRRVAKCDAGIWLRLLAAGVVIWGQPDHIAKLPGVKRLIGWVNQGRLPAAPPGTSPS